ncbi:MAG TPA: tetratricopeptide repeat protein [Acidobacteriota bacterium]|jgi:lipopolysaccharide biosynthesis regulator YciM|nr:tetratricopeptide repeat protein [Acidobacteriota bacterium]HNT16899.1 tetratricopeptide repeat protein [Acidobacteriota bacterium]HPA27825.1 tetratricopeptide repeat protein [Acidobacteriota bacterium]HQO20685.1 tetratricopeptide repeat protein [Acidobacteriota bacterium]HQQ47502.1 tetratricopeptide repeat protein [Acidobacteriota bacterium]
MQGFSSLISQHAFLFLAIVFFAGMLVGILGVRKAKASKSQAAISRPSDYILGMYSLFTGETESAIKRLSSVVEKLPDAVEVYLALGNLYRQRGQLEKAIRIHKTLLQRSGLKQEERILALDALGTDYRVGGFLDRALQSFRDALALDPKDTYALAQLVKLCEERGEWDKAYDYAKELFKKSRLVDSKTLSYHLLKKGESLAEEGRSFRAAVSFKKAIRLHSENTLAYMALISLYMKDEKTDKARKTFDTVIERFPHKSYIFFPLLKKLYPPGEKTGPEYLDILKKIALERHQKRALLLYVEEMESRGRDEEIRGAVRDLVKHFPRSRIVQKKVFRLINEGKIEGVFLSEVSAALSKEQQLNDQFVCVYCGYRTGEILPRCPNCKEWNSFSDSEN